MTMPGDLIVPPPFQLESIQFEPERIVVSFMERTKQSPRVQEVTTLIIDPDSVEQELAELVDAVVELVDKALLVRRAPPESIRSRNAGGD